ncbi:lipid-transfer protein [Nocardia sp. NPDC001965]
MHRKVIVAGVGVTPFTTPRNSEPYDLMGAKAVQAALVDAGLEYDSIQQAYVGYVYGESTAGQAAVYKVGTTGIPIFNVNNNCSTGSTALFLARQAIESGAADVVLALGFEQMQRGALVMNHYADRPAPLDSFERAVEDIQENSPAPFATRFFGGAGREYSELYDMNWEVFAQVAVKARRHAAHNPYAVFRRPVSVDEVLASPAIYGPLTRLQCCPPTSGAAAAVLVGQDYARRHGLRSDIRIAAQSMRTDFSSTFDGRSMIGVVGYDITRAAAHDVYEAAGVNPMDVSVVELHDCFTTNEVLSYEALGLTPEGTAEKFIADGDNTYGGRVVTNPSGGLLSKGHPLGATGLAQCAELVWQLRDSAGARQVEGAKLGLQHNIGLGGAAVVTLYSKMSERPSG